MDISGIRSALASLILLIFCTEQCHSIIAYDCGAPTVNLTTLSLLNIKDCNIPIIKPKINKTNIQLLQTTDFKQIKVIQCKVEVKRSVYYCGMASHISLVSKSHMEYVEEVSHEKCKTLQESGSYQAYNKLFTQIETNSTTERYAQLAGYTSDTGSCEGTSYSDYYGSWNSVVVQGQIFFTLQDYTASVNLENNEIILRSGVKCIYSKGKCMDVEGGNTYWDIVQSDQCKFDRFSVLYEGIADRVSDNSIHNFNDKIYSLTTNDITFALSVKGHIPICGYKLIKTEHPRLFIIDKEWNEFFTKKRSLETSDMDLFTYINSKFVYLERHLRTQVINLYNDIIRKECELERKILHNSLALATISPADFAYHFMKEAGFMAHVAGEVIRIAKCVTAEVVRRETVQCFQELPVKRGDQNLFMTPRTHILVKKGNQIECTPLLAPMYNINNAWYQFLPQLAPAVIPDEVATKTQASWTYIAPGNLATNGIYSDSDLEKLKNNMMFPLEKPAVLNTIARGASGIDSLDQGLSVNRLINENEIRIALEKAWGKLYNFFNTIGTFSVTLFGIWVTFKAIKFIIDTIVHGFALHTIYGWSLCLIGAIWDSVTNLLLHLGRNKHIYKKSKDVEIGIEQKKKTQISKLKIDSESNDHNNPLIEIADSTYNSKNKDSEMNKSKAPQSFTTLNNYNKVKKILQWLSVPKQLSQDVLNKKCLLGTTQFSKLSESFRDPYVVKCVNTLLVEYLHKDTFEILQNVIDSNEKKKSWSCIICYKLINTTSIQCNACMIWYHYSCAGISEAEDGDWFCEKCVTYPN